MLEGERDIKVDCVFRERGIVCVWGGGEVVEWVSGREGRSCWGVRRWPEEGGEEMGARRKWEKYIMRGVAQGGGKGGA